MQSYYHAMETDVLTGKQADGELVVLARSGDRQAFGRLIERYQALVKSVALRMVWQEDRARELAQEALLQAFLSLHRLKDPERFRSWLYGITINVCRSYLREMKAEPLSLEQLEEGVAAYPASHSDGFSDPQQVIETRELRRQLTSAIGELSADNRETVDLFYFRNLSLQEIAALLGVSVEAVKVRLHRARTRLRRRLLELYPEIDLSLSIEQRRQTMVRVKVADIVKQAEQMHVVVLLDDTSKRILPIWIGGNEALAIALGMRGFTTPRPMTYNLMASLIESLGGKLEEARVEALKEDTFYGVARLRTGEVVKEIDVRPSDVLALAVRTGSPIFVGEEVMEKAGLQVKGEFSPDFRASAGIDALVKAFEEEFCAPGVRSFSEEELEKCNQDLLDYVTAKVK